MIDISATGARLEINAGDKPPTVLSHDVRLRRHCSVVWRSGTSLGVEFKSAADAPTAREDVSQG